MSIHMHDHSCVCMCECAGVSACVCVTCNTIRIVSDGSDPTIAVYYCIISKLCLGLRLSCAITIYVTFEPPSEKQRGEPGTFSQVSGVKDRHV